MDRSPTFLGTPRTFQTLTEEFALHLRQYPNVTIIYDAAALDPSAIEDHVADYSLSVILPSSGRVVEASLTIIEWKVQTDRAIFLCDKNGFILQKTTPAIHAPGFVFTAYLRSSFIRELWDSGDLQLEELSADLRRLLDAGRERLGEHFRKRTAEKAGNLIEQWKTEEIYPCSLVRMHGTSPSYALAHRLGVGAARG